MNIGFVLFPELTQLDMTGPFEVLTRIPGSKGLAIAKTMDPVGADIGLRFVPHHTFRDAPKIDILVVPGGFGTDEAMNDGETIDFVRRAAAEATYVTSVCTGALVLGAAGLLKGRKATTHWAYVDLLPLFGAIPTEGRVVRDGNVFTGGGVTAGIDFALTLLAEVAGEDVAKAIQLSIEYDPKPPFDAGHPSRASGRALELVQKRFEKRLPVAREACERAWARFGGQA
jgi:cyclohexyl-isocyanide hydratase